MSPLSWVSSHFQQSRENIQLESLRRQPPPWIPSPATVANRTSHLFTHSIIVGVLQQSWHMNLMTCQLLFHCQDPERSVLKEIFFFCCLFTDSCYSLSLPNFIFVSGCFNVSFVMSLMTCPANPWKYPTLTTAPPWMP